MAQEVDYYIKLLEHIAETFGEKYEDVEEGLYQLKTFDQLFITILGAKDMGIKLSTAVKMRANNENFEQAGVFEQQVMKWGIKRKDWN